ncbi:chemotaxis protein CheB [Methylocystis sp. S23]
MQHPDIVAIGASAGGIEALITVVGGLPADFPASVLIAQHLSPASPGMLPQILSQAGPLPASSPEDGEALAPARIYVAPPNRHLLVETKGRLRLSRGPRENRARPAVDPLFRSAALAFGTRVIGVVLTGYLDDGTAGLQAIKLCGGAAIVQDPKEAAAPAMPLSALQNVNVDFCLPLVKIGPQLIRMTAAAAPERPNPEKALGNLATEVAIAAGRPPAIERIMQIGQPSNFTCPDCHGALMRLPGGDPIRFRCHTGHAFTAQALLAGLAEKAEDALWNAVRTLQEEGMLKRHMASHAQDNGEAAVARELLNDADEALAAAEQIRRIQEGLVKPSAEA